MQTSMFFENHGVGRLLVSQTPQTALVPWFVGSQPIYGEPLSQMKPITGDHISVEEQLPAVSRQVNHVIDLSKERGSGFKIPEKGGNGTVSFSIFPGTVFLALPSFLNIPSLFVVLVLLLQVNYFTLTPKTWAWLVRCFVTRIMIYS